MVSEKIEESSGTTFYGKDEIRATPGGNGDINSLLIRHPNVSFDNSQLGADTAGDIDPAKISINGAKFYDNKFTLDGASIKSNISGGVNIDVSATTGVPADGTQGLAVDTKILCGVEVLDANVSAQYGQFMGGVVDAQVCAPRKNFGGEISYEFTSSKWMDKKIENGLSNKYSTDNRKQNSFTKKTIRGNFESKVSDTVGIVGSFSKKETIIPLKAYSDRYHSKGDFYEKDYSNKIENFYLKLFSKPNRNMSVESSIMHSPGVIDGFNENTKNSDYQSTHGGTAFNTKIKYAFDSGFLFENQFSYGKTESSRYSESDNYYNWRYSADDKNWGKFASSNRWSPEGGYGDIEQEEIAKTYSWNLGFPDFKIGSALNKLKIGGSFTDETYVYARLNSGYNYMSLASATTCTRTDGSVDELCSLAPVSTASSNALNGKGQFLNSRTGWLAGRIQHDSNYQSIFLEDHIEWDRLKVRLGLRWDKTSDAKDSEFSPRFMATYSFGEYRDIVVETGANRYYGQAVKNYFILERKKALTLARQSRANINSAWTNTVGSEMSLAPDSIRMPYVDEGVLAVTKKFAQYSLGVKYVHRSSKDEIVLRRDGIGSAQVIYPANVGSSKSQNFSITLSSLKDWKFKEAKTNFAIIWDYQKRKSTNSDWSDYTNSFDEDGQPKYALFNGQIVRVGDLPASNFNRPWTLRFMTTTEVPRWGMKFDSFLRVRQAYKTLDITKSNVQTSIGKVNQYEIYRLPKSVTFDLRVTKNWYFSKHKSLYAELTVENLFNRTNRAGYDADAEVYLNEKGRQAIIKIGYEF